MNLLVSLLKTCFEPNSSMRVHPVYPRSRSYQLMLLSKTRYRFGSPVLLRTHVTTSCQVEPRTETVYRPRDPRNFMVKTYLPLYFSRTPIFEPYYYAPQDVHRHSKTSRFCKSLPLTGVLFRSLPSCPDFPTE